MNDSTWRQPKVPDLDEIRRKYEVRRNQYKKSLEVEKPTYQELKQELEYLEEEKDKIEDSIDSAYHDSPEEIREMIIKIRQINGRIDELKEMITEMKNNNRNNSPKSLKKRRHEDDDIDY